MTSSSLATIIAVRSALDGVFSRLDAIRARMQQRNVPPGQ